MQEEEEEKEEEEEEEEEEEIVVVLVNEDSVMQSLIHGNPLSSWYHSAKADRTGT